ncbi:MAG TPA: DUF3108 domain-containing protein [Kiritimatiellia bacterium]|nr:DUF3108 domain-containing protein [Kiritimatiellia bacterium]
MMGDWFGLKGWRWVMAGMMTSALILGPMQIAVAEESVTEPEAPTLDWFLVGEELVYDIFWGFLHVGMTYVTTEWVLEEGQEPKVRIRYFTRTNRVVEKLYPVESTLESLIRAESFLPVYFMKNSSEGKRRSHETTTFDHANRTMRWVNHKRDREEVLEITEDTRDLITTMYYFRTMDYEVGDELTMQVMADEKLYDLFVKVGARETVRLREYGDVECVRFEPEAAFDGLFVRSGKVTFWVSDDERRVATQVQASVPFANVTLKLREVKGPGDDFWIRHLEDAREGSSRSRGSGRPGRSRRP